VTDEMVDNTLRYTNEKIKEDFEERKYSAERLAKCPHLRTVDKVLVLLNYSLFSPFLSHLTFLCSDSSVDSLLF
jgi:hypothetical protein